MNDTTRQALVAPSDIAEMARVTRGAVSNWRKRADDFPEIRGGTPGKPLFARDEVLAWLSSRGHTVKKDHGEARVWSTMNALRGALPPYAMGELILTLACARKLSAESPSGLSLWIQIQESVTSHGLDGLRRVALTESERDPRWSFLVEQAADIAHADRGAVGELVRVLSEVDPTGPSLAVAADYVLARVARSQVRSGLDHGFVESRTSELLGNAAAASGGQVLYDPACGIGTALLAALDAGMEPERIVGHDINARAVQQAAQRTYLHGVDVDLTCGDILTHDLDTQLRADVIIAEPPFGMYLPHALIISDPRWDFGMPPRSKSETLWLQHVVAHLSETGRGFVITPVGTLFRGGGEKTVRTNLARRGCIETIIGLPGKMLPHVAVNLALWVLRAPSDAGRPDILFIDASDTTEVEKRIAGWVTAPDDAQIDVPHQRVDVRDILASDGNLSPAQWVQAASRNPAEVVNTYLNSWKALNQTIDEISGTGDSLRHFAGTSSARIVTVGELIDQGLLQMRPGRVKLADLPDELADRYVTPAQIKNGQLLPVEDTTPVPTDLQSELTEDGDVLASTLGTLGAVVDDTGGGHLLGSSIYRLRSTNPDQLNPYYLAFVLAGSWNDRFRSGSTITRVDPRLIEVPLVAINEQARVKLATLAVASLAEQAQSLLASTQSIREAMRDALRYNVAFPEGME